MKKAAKELRPEDLVKLTPKEIEEMPYENAMALLEQVVESLEQEGTSLELGLRLYETGTLISKRCGLMLDQTEGRMLQLLGEGTNAKEEEFIPEKDGR